MEQRISTPLLDKIFKLSGEDVTITSWIPIGIFCSNAVGEQAVLMKDPKDSDLYITMKVKKIEFKEIQDA